MRKPHKYRDLNNDQLEELFSNYLIDSWSYSKVMTFARNEKAFEMESIYGMRGRSSATTIAGQAYHEALEIYFEAKKNGKILSLPELEQRAFQHIDEMPAYSWKTQKTTPSIEECIIKATKTVTSLLNNFYQEKSVYDDIVDILAVELYLDEFLCINGVDIPLPCHMRIDLVGQTKDGKIAIVDHKSKAKFTDDKEAKFIIGKQAITYVNGYEQHTNQTIDEVWFVENKHSKNRDKSPQLNCIKIELDLGTRRLFEAMLYEPLKRMIEATSDPDYVYIMNDNDNFTDKAELNEFWAQTMIAEIDAFNVAEGKRDLVEKRLKKIRDASIQNVDVKVIKKFKQNASEFIQYDLTNKNMTNSEKIEHTLRTLGIQSRVEKTFNGYSSDTYLLEVGAGTKISSLFKYRLDIANALSVPNVRMMNNLYPYKGKSYFVFEVSKVRDKDVIWDKKYVSGMKIPIGLDNMDNVIYWDLNNHSTPHMLICGQTGSGKTVSVKSTVGYLQAVGVDDILIIDPKCDPDFISLRNTKGVQVLNDIEEIEKALADAVSEMNERVKNGVTKHKVIIVDEFADAKSQARKGKALDIKEMVQVGFYKSKDGFPPEPKMKLEKTGTLKSLEENLQILLQKGRSSGYRIISATQRASVKVINGDAKVNYPIQICFRVDKEASSRVVIDEPGGELLSGYGDGLIKSPDYPNTVRFQGFYKE